MDSKQSRRNSVRKMNQMNGDYLVQLKRPLCSELRQDVKGHSLSQLISMKREVDVMYRHRNIQLSKVKRSQDAAYATMLRLHKEKKILQKQAQKNLQLALREQQGTHPTRSRHPYHLERLALDEDDSASPGGKTGITHDKSTYAPTDKGEGHGDAQLESSSVAATDAELANKPPQHKTKVLEVRKGAPLQPLVRERSDPLILSGEGTASVVNKDASRSLTSFSKLDAKLLDLQPNSLGCSRDVNNDSDTRVHIPDMTSHRRKRKPSPLRERQVLPSIDEHAPSDDVDPPIEVLQTVLTDCHEDSLSDADCKISSSDSRQISQVKLNKLKTRRREQRMKEILDSEAITLFIKTARGDIEPSNTSFRRKTFDPPSQREKYFQEKMLRAQIEARISQENRVDDFFEKLEAEGRQRQQRLRDLRAAETAAATALAEPQKQTKAQPLVSLQDVMAAFGRVAQIPSDVDPESFEALEYCKYLRSTDYFSKRKPTRKSRTYKTSSWSLAE